MSCKTRGREKRGSQYLKKYDSQQISQFGALSRQQENKRGAVIDFRDLSGRDG